MRTRFISRSFNSSSATPLVLLPLVVACGVTALFDSPSHAAATSAVAPPSVADWNFKLDEDELEAAWTWAAPLEAPGSFDSRIAFHIQDAKNYLLLRVVGEPIASETAKQNARNQTKRNGATGRVALRFWRVVNNRAEAFGDPAAMIEAFPPAATSAAASDSNASEGREKSSQATASGGAARMFGGQLSIQRSAWRVRALWNGRVVATAYSDSKGGRIGMQTRGAARWGAIRIQPVAEAPFLRDDFMRAQGPDDPELPGQWHRVTGVWKTSGLLGPRADAALNPNPFVFRAALSSRDAMKTAANASAGTPVVATVGRWFWSDYTVSAALRPQLQDANAPLVAGISALRPDMANASTNSGANDLKNASDSGDLGVSGVLDFREGRARILVAGRVVATSAPFEAEPNQWHRLFLDPGPGTLRLVVDGVERARADAKTVAQVLEGPRMSTHVAAQGASSQAASSQAASFQGVPAQGEAALVAGLGGANYVDFDDVRIGPNDAVSDDFTRASVGRWDDAAGEWQTVPDALNGQRVKISAGRAITLTGSTEREEGLVEADFTSSSNQGVVFAARDAKNYFVARQRGGMLEIVEFAKGAGKILATSNASDLKSAASDKRALPPSISVEWRDGIITARSGSQSAMATVSGVPAGRVGVWAEGASRAVGIRSFRALGAAPGWGEEVLPERFTKDHLMKNWASNASLWLGEGATKWHTGDFFGDASLSLPLALTASKQGLQLMLGAAPDVLDAGARLKIERANDVVSFALYENGKVVGQATLPASSATGALRFVRRPISAQSVNLRVALGTKVLISTAAKTASAQATSGIVQASAKSDSSHMSTHVAVKVGVDASRAPALDWDNVSASTSGVMDYAFTGAPVDWRAGKGRWEVKERWTCSPQWGFFAGTASSNPTLWSRFATRGDWTLEAYIATPMDVTRGERGPSDLNISVGADGRDLASGYSFLFSGDQSRVNRVFRGDAIALEKPLGTPPGDGNTHQNWFYIRLERRQIGKSLNFRYSVNGQEIWNYTDPNPLRDTRSGARQLAFWTQNGGLSIARVRLWHSGIEARDDHLDENSGASAMRIASENAAMKFGSSKTSTSNLGASKSGATTIATTTAATTASASASASQNAFLKNALGEWRGRSDGDSVSNLRVVKDDGRDALRIANPQSGGDWTLFATQDGFDARDKPFLKFNYRVPASVFVNIYARIDGKWREIVFSGDPARLGEVLRNGNDQDFARNIAPSAGALPFGQISGVAADDKWHSASFDLLESLRKAGLSTHVEALAFAAPDIAYLRAGIGGNHLGAAYYLSDFNVSPGAVPTRTALTPIASAQK